MNHSYCHLWRVHSFCLTRMLSCCRYGSLKGHQQWVWSSSFLHVRLEPPSPSFCPSALINVGSVHSLFLPPPPKVNCLILFSLVRGSLFFDCFFWFFSLLFPIISSLLSDLPLLYDQGSYSSPPTPGFSLPIVSHVPNPWPLSINPSQWGHSHWLLLTVSTFPSVWTQCVTSKFLFVQVAFLTPFCLPARGENVLTDVRQLFPSCGHRIHKLKINPVLP